MTVDSEQILAVPVIGSAPEWDRVVRLSTSRILGHYAEAEDFRHLEGFYLESLVEAWLRDFAHGWKSAHPPGYPELEQIGLATRLRRSEIRAEAQV